MKKHYKAWTLIDWDGNTGLKLKCWRRSFLHGHVSVGVGNFMLICYSYGADNEDSISSTRQRESGILTEQAAMGIVDGMRGYHN